MDARDLPFVVSEHRRLFPHGFFPHLGPAFMTAYTREFPTSPHALAFVAEMDDEPVGFLVGLTNPALHRRHVLRAHGHRLLIPAVAALIRRPGLAWRFLRTRATRYAHEYAHDVKPNRNAEEESVPSGADGPLAVLEHVAVIERARSLGIGKELTERFQRHAAVAGCTRVALVTAAGPDGAGAYYKQRGWRFRGESRTPEGRALVTYERPLHPPAWPPGAAG
ncbi:MAG TPA: N-acetyltransferase [Streptomyces sp.]|nr:N-acetyltransferase [Streptomyces sp.]